MSSAIIHRATAYDALTWLLALGRERRFRERLLAPMRLHPGDALVDVGCGTGTLALIAKEQVGAPGRVAGVDASPEMIERARHKARRKHLDVHFEQADAKQLPFPDGAFDVAISTVTLHHIRRSDRVSVVAEMTRVLKPGGRLMLADFVFGKRHSVVGFLHHHVGLKAHDLVDLATGAGLRVIENAPVGMWDMHYVVATR